MLCISLKLKKKKRNNQNPIRHTNLWPRWWLYFSGQIRKSRSILQTVPRQLGVRCILLLLNFRYRSLQSRVKLECPINRWCGYNPQTLTSPGIICSAFPEQTWNNDLTESRSFACQWSKGSCCCLNYPHWLSAWITFTGWSLIFSFCSVCVATAEDFWFSGKSSFADTCLLSQCSCNRPKI